MTVVKDEWESPVADLARDVRLSVDFYVFCLESVQNSLRLIPAWPAYISICTFRWFEFKETYGFYERAVLAGLL